MKLHIFRSVFLSVIVLSVFINLLYLASPIYMLQIYDRVIANGSIDTLIYLTAILVASLLTLSLLEAGRLVILSFAASKFHTIFEPRLLKSALQQAGESAPSHTLRDLETVRGFVGSSAITPFFDGPWSPIFLIVLWFLHPLLGFYALASAIILLGLAVLSEVATRQPQREATLAVQKQLALADQVLSQSDSVRSMGMVQAIAMQFGHAASLSRTKQDQLSVLTSSLYGSSKFLRLLAQSGILGLGAFLVIRGELSAGSMVAGSILLGRALAPIDQAVGSWKRFIVSRLAYANIKTTLKNGADEPEKMSLPEPSGRIDAINAYVRADGSEAMLLNAISFTALPGEAIGIIGPSGAGKTTLCRLLCGVLAPIRGKVELDGAQLTQWPDEQLGRSIGYLPQSVTLLEGTLKDNIARMSEVDTEGVLSAAQLAEAHSLIVSLQSGYETRVGPHGHRLSTGQIQKIGLARALYGDPKVVILDEPNAHLDLAGEKALARVISNLKALNKTIFIVSHRENLLPVLDKLMVLKAGRIEMFGDKAGVLKRLQPIKSHINSAQSTLPVTSAK